MLNYEIKDGRIVFQCQCSFRILGPPPLPKSKLPSLKFQPDIFLEDHDINYKCPATWDLLGRGMTKTIFQLEGGTGKKWTKELKPDSILETSALAAIIRPGCTQSFSEGKSLTQHYCDRKNGKEEVTYIHPALEPILKETWGTLIYQESAMKIATDLAGFTEQEADILRKAIGKKLPEEMAKVKILFLEGCKKVGIVPDEIAAQIFDWIEKSQRYNFNKAHSVGYGLLGYICAFAKTHFPLQTYQSCLCYAKEGTDPFIEIADLVDDAKLMDIQVHPSDIRLLENKFSSDGESIFFGISDIKDVGLTTLPKIKKRLVEKDIDVNTVSWFQFLVDVLDHVASRPAHRLIEVGALRHFGLERQRMIAEYDIYHDLGEKTEKAWLLGHYKEFDGLSSALKACAHPRKDGGGCANVNRVNILKDLVKSLDNPPTPLVDTSDWIAWCEKEYLGVSITCTEMDKYDVTRASHTCKDIVNGHKSYAVLAVQLRRVNVVKTKKGKNPGKEMAFLTIADDSCALESVVVFPDIYEKFSALLAEDNLVFISGKTSRQGSFQVEKVYPME